MAGPRGIRLPSLWTRAPPSCILAAAAASQGEVVPVGKENSMAREQGRNRREFLRTLGAGAAAAAMPAAPAPLASAKELPSDALVVDPKPTFELSPYLYMQFMEPLGVTDSSVDAAWDFLRDRWRADVIEITKVLAPTLIRWGGCFCSYYRWKEGVGPRHQRRPMLNLLWGGIYNNQVGTCELVDFCRQVGAEPLIVVNFESDGRKNWAVSPSGDVRSGDAREAAEWVDYCNNPDNRDRRQHGHAAPFGVKLWQIGNETSYDPNGFDRETARIQYSTQRFVYLDIGESHAFRLKDGSERRLHLKSVTEQRDSLIGLG
jgi:hypothetical protein